MESILGFMEEEEPVETSSSSSPYSHKLVAWLSWDEWLFVSQALFSNSPDSVASALRRVTFFCLSLFNSFWFFEQKCKELILIPSEWLYGWDVVLQISAWKSRGCVPAVIEVTASIIEIHQKDPHFRYLRPLYFFFLVLGYLVWSFVLHWLNLYTEN